MDDQASPLETKPSSIAVAPPTAAAFVGPELPAWLRRAIVAGLILIHLLLANAGTWNKGATFDETAHIGNGFSFWATGDYRMAPDSVLPQRWMTFPLYLLGYQAPPTNNETWFRSDNWSYGRAFLYESGNDWQTMLHLTRYMNSLWDVGTALIVYGWAAYLFGVSGGFVALILYLFNPTALAHGSSVTIDAAATFALTASIAALWCMLQTLTPRTVLVSCLVIGLAFVTKFSAVLLVPVGVLMAVIRVASRRPWPYKFFGREGTITSWWAQPLVLLGLVGLHVVAAWIVIWCLFGFRYEQMLNVVPGRDGLYTGDWDQVLKAGRAPLPGSQQERNGALLGIIEFARAHRLLPEGYLYVFTSSVSTTSVRSSFLNGRYGIYGFPSFFPYCFTYKTPLAALCLIAFAWAAHVMRRVHQIQVEGQAPLRLLWNGFYATAPLWCLLFVYWFFSITRGINIGVRHILPTFPATFILVGAAGAWLYGLGTRWFTLRGIDAADEARFAAQTAGFRKLMQAAVCGFLLLLVLDVLLAFPNYLAYFNRLAGGSSEGYRHLVDSSLDWGQELPNLKKWLDKNVNKSSAPPKVYIS
jgi:4-amino-4-deoxy-L-arabinose transferase-like glycosyltransferase